MGAALATGAGCGPEPSSPAENACYTRWIAIDPPSQSCLDQAKVGNPSDASCACPAPAAGWISRRLFDVDIQGPLPSVPAALMKYCLYEQTSGSVTATPPVALAQIEPDCPVVAPQIDPQPVRAFFHAALTETVSHGVATVAMPAPEAPNPVVAIGFADTVKSLDSVPEYNDHGYVLGWFMGEVGAAAMPASPPVSVKTELAMNLHMGPDIIEKDDQGKSGNFGTRGQLAEALHRLVQQFRRDLLDGATEQRLVLPIAAGWEPGFGGSQMSPLSEPLSPEPGAVAPGGSTGPYAAAYVLPSWAVFEVLESAYCAGALALAAAGNARGGPGSPSGRLLPAAWEDVPAPSRDQCTKLWGVDAFPADLFPPKYPHPVLNDDTAAHRRLLRSIGGLDYADRPIPVTREGSLTTLAGPSIHATAGKDTEPLPALRTGTSVATAVAGVAAALAWSQDPSPTASDVHEILALSAREVTLSGTDGEACLPSTGQDCKIFRVSACAAMVCAQDYVSSGKLDCAPAPLECQVDPLETQAAALDQPVVADLIDAFESFQSPGGAPLKVAKTVRTAKEATTACAGGPCADPFEQYPSSADPQFVGPQPTWPTCGVCLGQIFGAVDQVILYLDNDSDSDLTRVTITFTDQNGVEREFFLFDSANDPLSIGARSAAQATVTDLGGITAIRSARMSWEVSDTERAGVEVMVITP